MIAKVWERIDNGRKIISSENCPPLECLKGYSIPCQLIEPACHVLLDLAWDVTEAKAESLERKVGLMQETMRDPVTLVGDGHTYERSAIEAWLARGDAISPMTGEELTEKLLIPNLLLKRYAEQLLEQM